MNQLRILFHKEWRDQRTLVIGALVVCLAAIAIARLLHGDHFSPLARTRFVHPGCLGLFTLVLATEAIARDVQNGVESTLLRLPIPRATAWFAKVGFVAVSGFAFFVLLMLIELLLRIFEQQSVLDGLLAMNQPTWWLLIGAVGASCMASACVLKRSLPAAFLGIAGIAGLPLLGLALPEGHASERLDVMLNSWTPTGLSAVACGAFLMASFSAFHVRRRDGYGLRRAGSAALGAGLVLVPAAAVTAHDVAGAFDIAPFSKTAMIRWISPSPDGRFLGLEVAQTWKARDNWIALAGERSQDTQRRRDEVWILDCTTGACKEIDERCRSFRGIEREWSSDGKLRTTSSNGYFGAGDVRVELIDPITGRVISSKPDAESGYPGRWYEQRSLGGDVVLRWKAKGRELRLPVDALMTPSTQPGVVFHKLNGYLVRHELEPDSTTRLALPVAQKDFLRVSPDGRHLLLSSRDYQQVLDASSGRLIHDLGMHTGLIEWSKVPGRIGLFFGADRGEWQVLGEDGSLTRVPAHFLLCGRELGPDRLLGFDGQHIECMKLDGSDRQVLYQARP